MVWNGMKQKMKLRCSLPGWLMPRGLLRCTKPFSFDRTPFSALDAFQVTVEFKSKKKLNCTVYKLCLIQYKNKTLVEQLSSGSSEYSTSWVFLLPKRVFFKCDLLLEFAFEFYFKMVLIPEHLNIYIFFFLLNCRNLSKRCLHFHGVFNFISSMSLL